MLPDFDERGLLPPTPDGSPYRCSVLDVEQRFVAGQQPWRRELFDGWDILRSGVAVLAPATRWWLWGNFISAHEEPLYGDAQTIDAIALLTAEQIQPALLPMLADFFRTAQALHRTDATPLLEFDEGDPRNEEIRDMLATKWLPRATRNIANYESRDLESAGFVEVLP